MNAPGAWYKSVCEQVAWPNTNGSLLSKWIDQCWNMARKNVASREIHLFWWLKDYALLQYMEPGVVCKNCAHMCRSSKHDAAQSSIHECCMWTQFNYKIREMSRDTQKCYTLPHWSFHTRVSAGRVAIKSMKMEWFVSSELKVDVHNGNSMKFKWNSCFHLELWWSRRQIRGPWSSSVSWICENLNTYFVIFQSIT